MCIWHLLNLCALAIYYIPKIPVFLDHVCVFTCLWLQGNFGEQCSKQLLERWKSFSKISLFYSNKRFFENFSTLKECKKPQFTKCLINEINILWKKFNGKERKRQVWFKGRKPNSQIKNTLFSFLSILLFIGVTYLQPFFFMPNIRIPSYFHLSFTSLFKIYFFILDLF